MVRRGKLWHGEGCNQPVRHSKSVYPSGYSKIFETITSDDMAFAWNGQGLPKVGILCEAVLAGEGIGFWAECEIIGYYSERQVWVRWVDDIEVETFSTHAIEDIEFRPFRVT